MAQLAVADGFYARKEVAAAVPEYEKFLIMAGKENPSREKALYRLGESQRQMGSAAAAQASFLSLLRDFPSGPFVPAASYRLGELLEQQGDHLQAADHFAVAAKGASDPMVRLAALHNGAVSLEEGGRATEAEGLHLKVCDFKVPEGSDNPYRIPSLLRLAGMAAAAKENAKALQLYGKILDAGVTGDLLGETAMKAAALEEQSGNTAGAAKLYARVTSTGEGRWQTAASLGALRIAALSGNDAEILKACETALRSDHENTPEILLLQANALRKTGKPGKALEDYDRILREFPSSKAAAQAPFQRLLALKACGKPGLDQEIDSFLVLSTDPGERARAKLLKAEETLRAGHYKEAAALYHDLPLVDLPASNRADISYKEAWALLQSGDRSAAKAGLEKFLSDYAGDERAPAALAQKALLEQQDGRLEEALAAFNRLAETYPKATERELALQQKALILGQLQRNPEMVAAFSLLLTDYPKSKAAPQAHYWKGWAALNDKDYTGAIPELDAARKGDAVQFGERATLRILLCDYYLDHPAEAQKEAMGIKPTLIPPEVAEWLGIRAMKEGSPEKAERFLKPLVREGSPGAQDPELISTLSAALTAQGRYKEALPLATSALKLARDPASRAKGLLAAASIQKALGNFQDAAAQADEAMLLQPEGPVNAEARILSGDLLAARKDFLGAAKAYMTVAVLNDDPSVTPRALTLAANAYRQGGNLAESQKALEELRSRFPSSPRPSPSQHPAKP
jgi:tetratricopeptide (TPR) repeat protein